MVVKQYRKKPVAIEAVQLREDNAREVESWCGGQIVGIGRWNKSLPWECELEIHTLEGTMTAHQNDWIIKGVQGEFYPCKPDIFEATYEAVA